MLLLLRCALRKFQVTDSQNTQDEIASERRFNVRDQIAFCALLSLLVEVQMNAGYIHAMHA